MRNIHVKMAFMIVLVILVTTGLLFSISYRKARDSMSTQLEDNYSVVADKYAQELTAWLNTNAIVIDTMAAEIGTNNIYEEDYEAFHSYLKENYDQLNKNGYIFDIYFTYPDNRMACASDFISDGSIDYSHERDWFTVAAGTGELFYSTPYRDSDSGKPIITISKAVYRDNKLQGVLAADIFVDVLVDIINDADVAPDSYAFLIDQNLGMIVHPNEAYAFDDVPHGVMEIPGAPYADVISKIRSGSNETVYLKDYDGVTRGIVVSKMENTGWTVGIATSKDELMKSMGSLMRGFLIAALIAVIIGGIITVIFLYVLDKNGRRQQEDREDVRKSGKQKKRTLKGLVKKYTKDKMAELSAESADDSAISRNNLRVPILVIFLLMVCMVLYTSRVINNVSVTNIHEVGEDRLSAEAAQLENYLEMSKSSLWVTADSVDHMVRKGASSDDILNYITEETEKQKKYFNQNYTGFYGYVGGEFLDGLGWVPPENYDPTRRDWYLSAIEADGDAIIVAPYIDAQTNGIIISICRMLSNGVDVVSLDVTMDHILEIVSDLKIKGKGYGFIVNEDGMIIAHQDEAKRGAFLTDDEEQLALFDKILEVKDGSFEIAINKEKSTVFVRQILNQWYMVVVISNKELMSEVRQQLIINVVICTIIFILIAFSYFMGYKNEQNYSRRIEEMRAEEQKQAYEAKALKLEKDAADQANQAKSDFLADMSHEIRTPINAVLGMNEMIQRESFQGQRLLSSEEKEARTAFGNIGIYAGNIERAGKNLLSIINDILDFSKIEAGKIDIVEDQYKLSSVLNDVSNMIFFKARDKGLEFYINVDETLPDGLYGDEVHLRQIMTNILNNAVKYTRQGSVCMEISCASEDHMEIGRVLHLIIAVRDTGIGIRQEDIAKLFTKFQRVDLDRNSTVEGTGLGLAITQSLLTMMDGSIQVESQYGQGSTFTVTLPQKITSCDMVGNIQTRFEEHMQVTKAYEETFRAPSAHVLIVDDTPMNLKVAVGLLKNTEMKIHTATNGEDALALTRANAYDLILMDQRMPGMDGVEALHRIKAQSDGLNRETPVICLTADAVIGAKERYLAEGFTDYLTKPINSQALEQMLMKYLPEEKVIPISVKDRKENGKETAEDGSGAKGYGGQSRPEGYGQSGSEGYGQSKSGGYGQSGPEGYGQGRPEGCGQGRPEGYGQGRSEGYGQGGPESYGQGEPESYGALREAGIDPGVGLGYCQGDDSLYLSLLEDYIYNAEENMRKMEKCKEGHDLYNLAIQVHALKSTSKMIGAAGLSDLAADMEKAADEGNHEAIDHGFSGLMAQYEQVVEAIRLAIPQADEISMEDEDVMEFFPE